MTLLSLKWMKKVNLYWTFMLKILRYNLSNLLGPPVADYQISDETGKPRRILILLGISDSQTI
jgi:hypothetical protein